LEKWLLRVPQSAQLADQVIQEVNARFRTGVLRVFGSLVFEVFLAELLYLSKVIVVETVVTKPPLQFSL